MVNFKRFYLNFLYDFLAFCGILNCMEFAVIFSVCIFSGVLTGLLGIGGGLVIVPAFLFVSPLFGMSLNIHQIIGISAACVFFNALSSLFYRRKEEFLPAPFLFKISLWIMAGTLSGVLLSSGASKQILLGIYIFVSLLSLYLIKSDVYCAIKNARIKWFMYLIFAFIGAISASIGIGGAVFFATAMKCFMGKDTKALLPSITFAVAINAFFAFAGKFAIGYITPLIIPIAIVSSLIGAKIGVIISHRLKPKTITNLMVIVLIISLIKIILEFMNL